MEHWSKIGQVSPSVKKHYRRDTTKLAATNTKKRESYENMQTLNYAYTQSLEIIFGTLQLAT